MPETLSLVESLKFNDSKFECFHHISVTTPYYHNVHHFFTDLTTIHWEIAVVIKWAVSFQKLKQTSYSPVEFRFLLVSERRAFLRKNEWM